MNFFGHAAVACWRSSQPAFVLGAMLPDFASMLRRRPPLADHTELDAGVRFHHLTDEAFHDLPEFRALVSRAFGELSRAGLERPSARAVAHVGIEILLDGVLAADQGACSAYIDALDAGAALAKYLRWPEQDGTTELATLIASLAGRGVSPEHGAPEVVAFRVERTLAGRRLLQLRPGGQAKVRAWSAGARADVEQSAPALLDALRARLAVVQFP